MVDKEKMKPCFCLESVLYVPFSIYFDAVGWVTERACSLKKTEIDWLTQVHLENCH